MPHSTGAKVAIDEASYQVDREKMMRAIRTLQVTVGVLALLLLGMLYALYEINGQAERSVSEINKIRLGIQEMFEKNLPLIGQINDGLAQAMPNAEKLNAALKAGGELDQRIKEGISRAEARIPAAIEDYMRNNMPRLLAEAQSRAREELKKR